MRYVGREPDSDYSVLPRRYVTDRYDTIRVDNDFITAELATQASEAGLVNQSYVDQQDALRAKKANVDTADANYIPVSQVGATNGIVPLDTNSYIPSQYLPTIQTERKMGYVAAQNIILSGERLCTAINPKEYLAATLTIPDPGFPYIPLIFAHILGGSINGNAANRGMGTGSYGQISVLKSDDTKHSWCLATSHKTLAYHTCVPFADNTVNPNTRPLLEGQSVFNLFLGLWSGNTYTFNSAGLQFYALVFPGF
ncbi:minor tail protein [Mycobacterium phage Phabba]|uniref:Minor tail protein n=1 Tax=Mycobacterium phage Phabba TaxID=2027899 RepID=A0A249XSU3_9CAUD|nr:minor tail protein [Mycobacterium phage Phabba]ASZ74788.1 hypothetical protein SEA_PHABBA_251 [Mycobacterium phage Phabba]